MGGLLSTDLARLGALSPFRLGLGFALPIGVARGLQLHGARVESGLLVSLGGALLLVLAIVLWIVVTWYRDDDALEGGALVGLSVGGGALLASVLLAGPVHGPLADAAWQLIVRQANALGTLVVLVPLCTAAIWVARRVSAALGWRFQR